MPSRLAVFFAGVTLIIQIYIDAQSPYCDQKKVDDFKYLLETNTHILIFWLNEMKVFLWYICYTCITIVLQL
jgi:hypothetical protein